MKQQASIRQAELSDVGSIREFLKKRITLHRHLDWRDPWEWVGHAPFLILEDKKGGIDAILCCAQEVKDIYWLRIFACKKSLNFYNSWNTLFFELLKKIRLQSEDPIIITLVYQDWTNQLVDLEGWKKIEQVISFHRKFAKNDSISNATDCPSIRKMLSEDIPQVHAIDTASFDPLWHQSISGLKAAFRQAAYATVYEDDGQILGFQISTAGIENAHLARIAVDPNHRRKKIAKKMLFDLFQFCRGIEITQISVNTQSLNKNSIALYHKLGFNETGNIFPIYLFQIDKPKT